MGQSCNPRYQKLLDRDIEGLETWVGLRGSAVERQSAFFRRPALDF